MLSSGDRARDRVVDQSNNASHLAGLCERLFLQISVIEGRRWAEVEHFMLRYDDMTAAKDAELAELRRQVAERDRIIQSITTSTAWKLIFPYRFAGGLIIRTVQLIRVVLTSPRAGASRLLRRLAAFVRSHEQLRRLAHAVLNRTSPAARDRLAAVAPAPVSDVRNHPAGGGQLSSVGNEAWVWLADRITLARDA